MFFGDQTQIEPASNIRAAVEALTLEEGATPRAEALLEQGKAQALATLDADVLDDADPGKEGKFFTVAISGQALDENEPQIGDMLVVLVTNSPKPTEEP